ncbi:MAG: hypothetical protein ABIR83_07330 [Nakamurella sp.]
MLLDEDLRSAGQALPADRRVGVTENEERVRRGLRRVAGISASLVGSQALTSVLGLVFWTLAARTFATSAVGVAGAAVSMMMLLGSLGSMGLGTLLIARLPVTEAAGRRVMVRTCLFTAGTVGALLAVLVPVIAIHVFGADNLRPIAGSPWALLGLAAGTALTSVVLVLDQAVLTIGFGSLQLERNITASVVKIVALLALAQFTDIAASTAGAGMLIFLAVTIGNLLSLPIVAWRTRGGRAQAAGAPLLQLSLMRGLGRMALSHHALNTTLQAALQILPILVTLMVSSRENAYFNSALMVCGFVFALPYSIAIGLFASAGGDERDVLSRMRLTIPFSLVVSITAYLFLLPLAGTVLGIFGSTYAEEGAPVLRLLALAGVPFVIKDHWVALRRVQGRTTDAVRVLALFLVVELAAAVLGAAVNGTIGLVVGWLSVLALEALLLVVPLWRGYHAAQRVGSDHAFAAELEELGRREEEHPTDLAEIAATASTFAMSGGLQTGSMTEVPHRAAEPPHATDPSSDRDDRPAHAHRWSDRWALIGNTNLFGPLLLTMALGVGLMAMAADNARGVGSDGRDQALWVLGQVLIYLPAVVRIVMSRTRDGERIALALAVGVMFQLSRRVLYPLHFAYHDELLHATTLGQIEQSGHLFSLNSLLPVSGYYPGLEIVTDAVSRLTGLSALNAATVVLVLARIIMILSLIGLIRLVSGSTRIGAIAAVLYLCNPQFLFFNSQYSYQTLALPLAVFAVYAFLSRRRGSRTSLLLPISTVAGVTMVHHLTGMLLVAGFGAFLLVELLIGGRARSPIPDRTRRGLGRVDRLFGGREVRADDAATAADDPTTTTRRHRQDIVGLLVMTVSGVVLTVLAALNPGSPVGGYLVDIFANFGGGVSGLATGDKAKPLFSDSAGSGPAPWEQVLLVAGVFIAMACLVLVVYHGRINLRRRNAAGVALAAVGLLYPIIPGGHLSVATAEVGDRAAGFVYLGLAAAVAWWLSRRHLGWRSSAVVGLIATVAFLGGVILGAGPTARQLPGPYLISADARSIDADNLAAADFLATALPANTRVYADRIGGLLADSDGNQFTVRHLSTGVDASRLLLDPNFTPDDVDVIRRAGIQYLIVDTRLSDGLPHLDVYIETGEFEGRTRTAPVSPAALQKFAAVPGVDRIYDNGSVMIYDVRGLTNG